MDENEMRMMTSLFAAQVTEALAKVLNNPLTDADTLFEGIFLAIHKAGYAPSTVYDADSVTQGFAKMGADGMPDLTTFIPMSEQDTEISYKLVRPHYLARKAQEN